MIIKILILGFVFYVYILQSSGQTWVRLSHSLNQQLNFPKNKYNHNSQLLS